MTLKPLTRSTTPPGAPAAIPKPLPRGILPAILDKRRMLLCLDYDGTLSEITARPADARPVALARPAINALARHTDRIALAIISGRDLKTLAALLEPEGRVWMVGSHGIEMVDPAGRRYLSPAAKESLGDLAKVRAWMRFQIPRRAGFVVEDKRVAIALHYRTAAPAAASIARAKFAQFVASECPRLRILGGKMVDEVLPRAAGGKGEAVRRILAAIGPPAPMPVYFGDDATDEDAFLELRDEGVTVRVGAAQRSYARYRVASPAKVVAVLGDMVAMLESARKTK